MSSPGAFRAQVASDTIRPTRTTLGQTTSKPTYQNLPPPVLPQAENDERNQLFILTLQSSSKAPETCCAVAPQRCGAIPGGDR